MAIRFHTEKPKTLLAKFDQAIQQEEAKGKITTWTKIDGFYTHEASQWHRKAFLKATANSEKGILTFNIYAPKNGTISRTVYGYYHGHLIETFLNHFDGDFAEAGATAKAVTGDQVKG